MFGKPKAKVNQTTGNPGTKKKAPPRPPPPSNSTIISRSSSIAFDPWLENKNKTPQIQRAQSTSCSYNITNRSDLIDLSSPTNSPPKTQAVISVPGVTSDQVPDFKYHVGASIFYIKSELKSSGKTSNPASNPFSPPRPSPQSILNKPLVSPLKPAQSVTQQPKLNRIPTIIKSSPSLESNNNNNKSAVVPLVWDEPPKPSYVSKPTVIRPIPPPKKPGLGLSNMQQHENKTEKFSENNLEKFSYGHVNKFDEGRSDELYDLPPEMSDEEEESYMPMPSEPPPPLPSKEIGDSVANYGQRYSTYSDQPAELDRAYGIALYDYNSTEPGDLNFYVGDVIYLTKVIDESWLYGTCGSLEGMFPSNFINVVVPLSDDLESSYSSPYSVPFDSSTKIVDDYNYVDSSDYSYPSNDDYYKTPIQHSTFQSHYITALHDFDAVEPNDLTIREGEIITVKGKINDDWLYGELNGLQGQFPASFIEYVPVGLQVINLNQ